MYGELRFTQTIRLNKPSNQLKSNLRKMDRDYNENVIISNLYAKEEDFNGSFNWLTVL